MPIATGGIFAERGAAAYAHQEVLRQISEFAPRTDDSQYVVDIAFVTGSDVGPNSPHVGVSPGPVGRSQRRFIVWHRLPEGLTDATAVRQWFATALVETESLVRDYLPRKSKSYPVSELASEVRALRERLLST
jgi:hypothetical protein